MMFGCWVCTLSPARTLNDAMTWSAVSVSAVSRDMKSMKAWNVTTPSLLGSTMLMMRANSASPFTTEKDFSLVVQQDNVKGCSFVMLIVQGCNADWLIQKSLRITPCNKTVFPMSILITALYRVRDYNYV